MPKLILDKPKGLRLVLDEPGDIQNNPNDVSIRAKKTLEAADTNEVILDIAERGLDTFVAIKKKKDATGIGLGPMWDEPGDTRTMRERLGLPAKKTYPINLGSMAVEVPKGLARFLERDVGGTFGGTVYDWLGQFIAEGGYAVDWLSKLGLKDKDRLYNPLAESIIATGQNISTHGRQAREWFAYQATTGWEAMNEDLQEKDPISYGAGRLTEGVASSALSVLAMYLSGGASATLMATTNINRGLAVLSTMSAAGAFEHAQNQGENFYWATIHGLADGMTEYAMESKFLDGVGKGTGKLMAGAREGAEEFFTGMLQNTRAGILENQAKGMSAYDASKKAMRDAFAQAPWEVAAGFIGGFGIAGGSDLVQLTNKANKMPLVEAKPPSKAVKKPPSKPVKAKPAPKAKITPVTPEVAAEGKAVTKEGLVIKVGDKYHYQTMIRPIDRIVEVKSLEKTKWGWKATLVDQNGKVIGGQKNLLGAYQDGRIERLTLLAQPPTKAEGKLPWEMTKKEWIDITEKRTKVDRKSTEYVGLKEEKTPVQDKWIQIHKEAIEKALSEGKPVPAEVLAEYPDLAQPVAKAEPPKVIKPKLKPIEEEKRDILGGVDPINQIHTALKAAKAVRPITEAAKKEALRKRVGAAAGALRAGLKKGMPAEQAILKSTGLLKGPLTEYDQRYESIEDTLEPGAKDAAYGMIARHPDLKYFEVVNTQKSFQKLLAGSDLTPKDAENIERVFGKVFDEIVKPRIKKSDLYERLIATWKAGLLTGMKTSGLNILSTASHAVSETAKDIPAALVDSGVALVTGERKVAFTAKGYPTGWVEGLGKGWKYMKTGYDERNVLEKYDYKKTNFGTSKRAKAQQAYVEFIFHLLGAEDQPWYYGALSRSLYSQAIVQAKNKGLKGKERQVFVDNIQKNPTDEMLEWAKEDAETAIYTNRTHLGDVAKSIQKVKGGEVIVPFGRTPSAVAMQIINYSPVGVVKEISHQIHKGKFNQRKFSQAAGRTVVGTAALYLGVQLFKAGLIALGYPKNERERKLWELEGKKPNSVLIDGKWRGIEVLGPAGNLLVIGGYFQQALDSKGSPTEAIIEAMAGGAKSFTEQTFVRGVNLAVDALTDPEASFERWFTSMSGSLVPTIVADIARAQDDRARRAVGPKERIQSRIPIYRRGLPPRIDVFGQDLPRYGGNVLETMIDPTRPSKIRQDIVVDELRRLWDKDIKVSPTLLGDKAGYDILTKEENTQLWQRAGELTYKGLFAAINSEGYKEANDFGKGRLLDLIVRNAKTAAKLEIVVIKKEQGKTIMQLAESGLFTVEEFEMLKYFQSNPIEE